MKHKSLILAVLILLSGCNINSSIENSSIENSSLNVSSINDSIATYMDEIYSKLPNYIIKDYSLPTIDDSSYTIEYTCPGIKIINNTLIYEDKESDFLTTLSFKISNGSISKTKEKELYSYSLERPMLIIEKTLKDNLPSETTSDVILPQYEDINISWATSDSSIFTYKKYNDENYVYTHSKEVDRLIYDFPIQNKEVTLNAIASINKNNSSYQYSMNFKINFLSYNEANKLPRVDIFTENNKQILDKENYINSTFKLTNKEEKTEYEVKVKGRGNSTWEMVKKPYALKFDEKVQLLDGVKSKQWCLLANHADQSLMRNYLALSLGNSLDGLEWNPTPNYVDFYLNGEYQGNYLLTEKVSAAKEKVNILEDTFDTNSGYLIEMDARAPEEGKENEDYFTLPYGAIRTYALKSPEKGDDYYSKEKLYYIKDYMNKALNTIRQKDNYLQYIDINSFIDWYIVNEVFMSVDAGYSSVYFNKDKDGKLKIGPLWDMDLSAGNPGHLDAYLRRPKGFYVPRSDKNIWFHYLLKDSFFQERLVKRWNEIYPTLLKPLPMKVFETLEIINYSAYKNFTKWNNIIGQENEWFTATETLNRKTYEEQVQFLYDYLKVRIDWLNTVINKREFKYN